MPAQELAGGVQNLDVALEDVLTTVAALMAGIDRNIGGTVDESNEGGAVGAEVSE